MKSAGAIRGAPSPVPKVRSCGHSPEFDRFSGRFVAIVPIRAFAESKSRIEEVGSQTRFSMARRMAERTLSALARARSILRIIVVTNDQEVAELALQHNASVEFDRGRGMNSAFKAGLSSAGSGLRLLVPADFLNIVPQDFDDLTEVFLARAHDSSIGLVPCKNGDGTNAVLLAPGAQFAPKFGSNSFSRHRDAAGHHAMVLRSEVLALDVDTLRDAQLACGRYAERSLAQARVLRDEGFGELLTYSPKVFLPLTRLCRDVCHYCTFATTPAKLSAPYLALEEAVAIAAEGYRLGCREALITLGEKPELRWREARDWLAQHGYESTIDYVAAVATAVRDQTGMLPHINAGCLDAAELSLLRSCAASMGLMLESASERLCEKGGAHHGSPDKHPAARLATLEEAGRQQIPFTTGILIGIGETREERIEAFEAIAAIHARHGHIQEIIVQNFVPKQGTPMAKIAPVPIDDLCWTIAEARRIFGASMSIQAPPNLNPGGLRDLIDAGINDWGGISPLTVDHVNPECSWPEIEALRAVCAEASKQLAPRLTIYPRFLADPEQWIDPAMRRSVLSQADGALLARADSWVSGASETLDSGALPRLQQVPSSTIIALLREIEDQGPDAFGSSNIATLFSARGADFHAVCEAADEMRKATNGDAATYIVNRNINYTNICAYACGFCAFSKGSRKHAGGEAPYLLDPMEIARRAVEAQERGATEVCLQGGIHPGFNGETYLEILRAVKSATPDIHIHAFSPLEITHGARTLGLPLEDYLRMLKREGLGSLPGTAAEILDDEVRRVLCADKLTTDEWIETIEIAHGVGLHTTATIMFGHLDGYVHWGRHLEHLRALQMRTGGITEFVPLPFVAAEAPLYRKGKARRGPTLREAILMHAVARLYLGPSIPNIQASWVKLGPGAMARALASGANDMGGVLMNESITRAAGATHGQQMSVAAMKTMAESLGRRPVQRTTLYDHVPMSLKFEPSCVSA